MFFQENKSQNNFALRTSSGDSYPYYYAGNYGSLTPNNLVPPLAIRDYHRSPSPFIEPIRGPSNSIWEREIGYFVFRVVKL